MLTNLQRFTIEEDIVLVSPQPGLCPECKRGGYDGRPGAANPPPKTVSTMPRDFEDLERRQMSQIERASMVPPSILRPVSPSRVGASRLPSNTYSHRASRVPPQSKAPGFASQAVSKFPIKAPSQHPSKSPSKYPDSSGAARESCQPSQSQVQREAQRSSQSQQFSQSSQIPRESQRPSHHPSSTASKSATVIYNPVSKVPTTAPHIYERTKAPPADEEGPNLDELLSSASISPSSKHSEPLSPPGSIGYPGKSSSYSSSAPRKPQAQSKAPGASSTPRPEAPRQSLVPSLAKGPGASLVKMSEVTRYSQAASHSKKPGTSSRLRYEVERES
jgi:hypothetical protein